MDDTTLKQTPQQQKPKTMYQNDNVVESLRALGGNVGQATAKAAGGVASDIIASLFGTLPKPGEARPFVGKPERQPFSAFRRPETRREPVIIQEDQQILKQQIEAIRHELKALAASIKNLNSDIQRTITEVPVDPGIYHKNFLERIRSILMLLREQIDDSRTWLSLFTQRKQKRAYWGMYKKHGTSFGLSSERTIATSAG